VRVAILAALSAAALFATATALQHRSAGLVSATGGVPAARLSGFMCKTLRHPMWVLGAAITSVDPVISLVIGVAVFDEHFRNSPADLPLEALGLALVVTAATGLTRSGLRSPHDQNRDPRDDLLSRMAGSAPSKPPSSAFTTGPAPRTECSASRRPAITDVADSPVMKVR
jgi:hypothetical protein